MCCIYDTALCKPLPHGGSGTSGSGSLWFEFVFFTPKSSDFFVFNSCASRAVTHRGDCGYWNHKWEDDN